MDGHLHHLSFKPVSTMGFKMAQCTAGGIADTEVDGKTLASQNSAGSLFCRRNFWITTVLAAVIIWIMPFNTGRRAAEAAVVAILQGDYHV